MYRSIEIIIDYWCYVLLTVFYFVFMVLAVFIDKQLFFCVFYAAFFFFGWETVKMWARYRNALLVKKLLHESGLRIDI